MSATRVWTNNNPPTPTVSLSIVNAQLAENGGVGTVTATLSAAHGQDVLIDLGFSGTASPSDFTASAAGITVPTGSTSGTITITSNDDTVDEADETVVVDITNVTNGRGFTNCGHWTRSAFCPILTA